MSTSFSSAVAAAQHSTQGQSFPPGALYVVATPIGNLADISLRALAVLAQVDAIACEDTRHTQALLRSYGLQRPSHALIAVHQHNEAQAAQLVIERLTQGQRIAYVSDAGTPGVSDPGARLCAALAQAGLRSIPIPGASSIISALSVAGCVPANAEASGFVFEGFLPTKAAQRQAAIERVLQEPRCTIVLEAPHRIVDLVQRMAQVQAERSSSQALSGSPSGQRLLTIAKEISKQFEHIITLEAAPATAWLQAEPQRCKGEFVLIVHPLAPAPEGQQPLHAQAEQVLHLLLQELPTKTAVKLCAQITGQPRNQLYERALAWQKAAAAS
ncbi:MAG: 16S rRNA (cytidine(1402)-2'-O)-methyltransferase [Comamonas sp.]|nr:16S rRNA (cytidine(1402)-2'-O)-methyltransferase [Comamonas sp.]